MLFGFTLCHSISAYNEIWDCGLGSLFLNWFEVLFDMWLSSSNSAVIAILGNGKWDYMCYMLFDTSMTAIAHAILLLYHWHVKYMNCFPKMDSILLLTMNLMTKVYVDTKIWLMAYCASAGTQWSSPKDLSRVPLTV